MAYFKFALSCGLCFCGAAHALYVTPSLPENFKTVKGVGYLSISPSDASFSNGIRSKIAGGAARVALAGGGVDIPVAYKFAAAAGKAAASVAFGWPGVVLLAGGLLYQWYTDHDLVVDNDVWKKVTKKVGVYYSFVGSTAEYPTPDAACVAWHASTLGGTWEYVSHEWPSGVPTAGLARRCYVYYRQLLPGYGYINSGGSSTDISRHDTGEQSSLTPVSKSEFETIMEPAPVPVGVPQLWPDSMPKVWWPVLPVPILNPSPVDPANPLASPVSTPLRVPQGNPVPSSPATDPQTYTSPVVDIVPSPSLDSPWRLDVQPKTIVTTSPEPLVKEPVPLSPPAGQTEKPSQEQLDLCALHPEILACSTPQLNTPESDDLDNVEKPLTFIHSPFSGSGSCPAPVHVPGANVDFKYDLVCDFMSGVKPLVIAFASLSAGFIILGARGGGAE